MPDPLEPQTESQEPNSEPTNNIQPEVSAHNTIENAGDLMDMFGDCFSLSRNGDAVYLIEDKGENEESNERLFATTGDFPGNLLHNNQENLVILESLDSSTNVWDLKISGSKDPNLASLIDAIARIHFIMNSTRVYDSYAKIDGRILLKVSFLPYDMPGSSNAESILPYLHDKLDKKIKK
jgi:hypothetical protein